MRNISAMRMVDRVEDYIKTFGSITTLEAFRDLGCSRLSEYIRQLKVKYADNEETELAEIMDEGENLWGDKTWFKRWYFKQKYHQMRLL